MRRILIPVTLLAVAAVAAVGGSRLIRTEVREVTTNSDEAYHAYRDGLSDTSRFRLEDAHEDFARAVALDPDFAIARARLALTAREIGDRAEFETELSAARELGDKVSEIESLWIERIYAVTHGEHARGMELYQEMAEKYPDHPWVLRLEAEFAKMNQRYDEALAAYDAILAQDPQAVDMHNLKGYLYLAEGDYERAIQSLERYAYYAPEQANPHDSLGEAYMYSGRYEEAILEFRRALDIDPTFVWSGVHLSQVLSVTGQFQNAIEVLEVVKPVFVERGQQKWFEQQRMVVDYMAERWDALVQETEAALPVEIDPSSSMDYEFASFVHYARTAAYLGLGEIDRAKNAVAELIALIDELRKQGEHYRDMQPVIALNRAFLMSRFARAEGEPGREIDALRSAIDKANLSPHVMVEFRHELGIALLEANRAEEATAEANVVLDVIPTQPDMNLLAAKAYRVEGERERSIAHLRNYLEVMRFADEGHPGVGEARQLLQRMVPRS